MQNESACIKVSKTQGEKAIILAYKLKLVNNDLEIQSDEKSVYIPITNQPSEDIIRTFENQIPGLEVTTRFFPERKKAKPSLIEILEDRLPPHLLASLPRAMDFVGDIAIIEIPPQLEAHKNIIGEAILKTNQNVQTVLAKAGPVSGTHRLRDFTVVAGEPKTETVHKEYGCHYYVDLAKVYFSPRLSYEHNRVASLVKEGETVVDMFAGVGPFAIQVAKKHQDVKVYAVDVNPYAIEYLKKNVRFNKVVGKVHPILGDARQVVDEKLSGIADRVIMNLPEKAIEFVDAACKALKPVGGIIHFYSFTNDSDSLENVEQSFTKAVERIGREAEGILYARNVRETAPYEFQVVLDIEIH
jgi:tRNA (guanine37-N1)-methyltransferase